MSNIFGNFQGKRVTGGRVAYRILSVGASDHSLYASDLEGILANYIPVGNIQTVAKGGRYVGKMAFENRAALIEDFGHPQDRFTTETNIERHLFRIFLSFGDLRRQQRWLEIADLVEAIARLIDKNLTDFPSPDNHQDSFASTSDTEDRTRGGFKLNDGIIDVDLRQEVS